MSTLSQKSTRRRFLARGLWGSALLAAGGLGLLATRRGLELPLPPEGLVSLSPREYAVVQAIAERLVPPRPGFPSPTTLRVAFHADRVLGRADPSARSDLKKLLGLFEAPLLALLLTGRPTPFTRLSPAEQDAVLEGWQGSRLAIRRGGFQALRSLVLASYYGSPLSWAAVGYPGPPQGFHDPAAPVWKGGGAPRPAGNGVFVPSEEGER